MTLRQERLATLLHLDLAKGTLRAGDAQPMLALPPAALQALLEHCPLAAVEELGRSLGTALGAEARAMLTDADTAAPEHALAALSVVVASRGLGTVALERWGSALVLCWRAFPLHGARARALASAAAGTMVSALTGAPTFACTLEHTAQQSKLLLGAQQTCDAVAAALASGTSWGQLSTRLAPGGA